MNSLWAMCNPQQGISQVLLDDIFTMKCQRGWENTFVLLKQKGGVDESQAVYRKKTPTLLKKTASPLPGCNALHRLAEGPGSSQAVRTQWWPSGTNYWSTVVHSSHRLQDTTAAAFWKTGTIPSKCDYSHESGQSLYEWPSWDGYTHSRNGSAQHWS